MKLWRFSIVLLLMASLLITVGCSQNSTQEVFPPPEGYSSWEEYNNRPITSTTPIQSPTYSGPEVKYEITGTAKKVSVTLSNATGGTEQHEPVYLPKTYTYYIFDNWFMYISAQNLGESGSVEVAIYYNGTLIDSASSYGAYVIASASGSK